MGAMTAVLSGQGREPGRHMPRWTIPRVVLDDEVARSLGKELEGLGSPYDDLQGMRLAAFGALIETLPPEVLASIVALRSEPAAPGALVLSNLPADRVLPRTPADGGTSREKTSFVSEGLLLAVASILGQPFSFLNEKDGAIIHSISPVLGQEEEKANYGSLSDFLAHVECAYFELRPDFLLLICLRPDEERQAGTLVGDIRNALQYLSSFDRAMLRQPLFQIQAPTSFAKKLGGQPWSEPRPVLSGPDESPEVCLNLNGMRAVSPGAEKSLDLLRHLFTSPAVVESVVLEAGELLIVDNRKSAHGRSPFKARYDGFDRWLQRVYVKVDLWSGRGERGKSVLF